MTIGHSKNGQDRREWAALERKTGDGKTGKRETGDGGWRTGDGGRRTENEVPDPYGITTDVISLTNRVSSPLVTKALFQVYQ